MATKYSPSFFPTSPQFIVIQLIIVLVSLVLSENSLQTTTIHDEAIYDPRVFNYYFYATTNSLYDQKIYNITAVKDHWNVTGIKQGLQACGSFHVKQYLDRYPDLKKKYGIDYYDAILDYLNDGYNAKRLGYVEGGAYGRYTISLGDPSGVFVSASDRMAGAIDSIVWNSNEFINSWDHGRECQFAITTEYGECYNPTEAGNNDDAFGQSTTSVNLGIRAMDKVLQSTVLPAFWLEPGEHEANPSPSCTVALNQVKVSNYTTSKTVTLGAYGIPNAIKYKFNVTVPENVNRIQIEAPTGYMNIEYDQFYTFNLTSGELTPVNHSIQSSEIPLIFATSDSKYAMGAFIKDYPPNNTQPIVYVKFYFKFEEDPNSTTKWTMVWVGGETPGGTFLVFDSYICVGTLADVQPCLLKINKMN